MKTTADCDTNRARVMITGKVLNGNRDKALPALEGACLSVVNKSLEVQKEPDQYQIIEILLCSLIIM